MSNQMASILFVICLNIYEVIIMVYLRYESIDSMKLNNSYYYKYMLLFYRVGLKCFRL